jgi:hypothetical protein
LDRSPSAGSLGRNESSSNLQSGDTHQSKVICDTYATYNLVMLMSDSDTEFLIVIVHVIQGNTHFMRKIPAGAEASNILVGEVDFLDKPLSAFVRLSQSVLLGDLTEVPVPTRFLFVLLGPMVKYILLCRRSNETSITSIHLLN